MNNAAQKWLVFSAESYAFAFQSDDVIEIIRVTDLMPSPEPVPCVLGWINMHGKMVAVVDLVENLYHEKRKYPCHEIVVVKGKDKPLGIAIERLLAVMQPGSSEADFEECLSPQATKSFKGIRYLKADDLCLMVQ